MFNKLLVLALLGVSLNTLPGARGLPLKELQAEKARLTKLMEMEEKYQKTMTEYVSESSGTGASLAEKVPDVAPKVAQA